MKVTKKTIDQWMYTRSDGREMPVAEMEHSHLLNSYTKAVGEYASMGSDDSELELVIDVLKKEITKRLYNKQDDET